MPQSNSADNANYFEALFKNTKQNSVLLMDAEGTIVNVNDYFFKKL